MSVLHTALLVVAGGVAALFNVAAVGGATWSFLALLAVGLPVDVANASNLAAMPASFLGGFSRAWKGRDIYRPHWRIVVVAVGGCVLGALLVTYTGNHWLREAAPVLLVVAGALIVFQPQLERLQRWVMSRTRVSAAAAVSARVVAPAPAAVAADSGTSSAERSVDGGTGWVRQSLPLVVAMFATGMYAGAFGGGVGALVVAALLLIGRWTMANSTDGKLIICLATSVVGSAVFILLGHVAWEQCLAVAVGMVVGAYIGGRVVKRVSDKWLRISVAVTSGGAAMYMLFS